jgi:hypothetical protein
MTTIHAQAVQATASDSAAKSMICVPMSSTTDRLIARTEAILTSFR